MLFKLLTVIGVAMALYGMARRALGQGRTPPPQARGKGGAVADLTRCARCGAWRPPEESCACAVPPTP